MMSTGPRDTILELKKRTEQQEGGMDLYLLSYIAGVMTASELLEEANLILARLSGYRRFLMELTNLMLPSEILTEARSKVLAVEVEIERQMTRLFERVVLTMDAKPAMLLWAEYLGFSLTSDSPTTITA